jgi:TPR repeat protein
MLADLASGGSALAMMYLGHDYVSGDDPVNSPIGEEWLKRSADAGSIEGRLQLAVHYQRQKRWAEAEAELKLLSDRNYSPAMYAVGNLLYAGHSGQKAVPEAIHYLKLAMAAGHLPASGLLSWIYRKEKFGLRGRVMSHWHCAAKIPSAIWYLWNYPNSDRLRRG